MPADAGVDALIVIACERTRGEVGRQLTILPGIPTGYLTFHIQNSAIHCLVMPL